MNKLRFKIKQMNTTEILQRKYIMGSKVTGQNLDVVTASRILKKQPQLEIQTWKYENQLEAEMQS